MWKRLVALSLLVVIAAAACGRQQDASDPTEAFRRPFTNKKVYPVVVSSEVVVGKNRLLLGLRGEQDQPVGSPDIDVRASFFDFKRSPTTPVFSTRAEFVWTIEPYQGVYAAPAQFDSPGEWGVEIGITGKGLREVAKTTLRVERESKSVGIGEPAPPSNTPTLKEQRLALVTTDDQPDPRFYRSSIRDALAAQQPFVVVFATPKFCTSRVCGPTLDIVKRVSRNFPNLTFIHVEVYRLPTDPSNLRAVPAMEEWGLRTEPWVFVVDGRGRVAAKYEGTVGPEELTRELEKL